MCSEPTAEDHAPKSGIFYPEDLAVLQALFNRACWINKTRRGSEEANSIAQRLVWAYRVGVRDRDFLTQIAAFDPVDKESQKLSFAANEQSPGQQTAA
jgi:hypothetical protein